MLILCRRVGQSIFINDNIKITVKKIKAYDYAELAIFAPVEIPVHREEVKAKIKKAEEINKAKGITITYKKNKLTRQTPSTTA